MRLVVGLLTLVVGAFAHSKVETARDGSSGSIKFTTPDMNDEEQESPFMPSTLQCDACRAITIQLYDSFRAVNRKHKSLKYNLPESEIIDTFEEVCTGTKLESYGIKEIDGVKRISGHGMDVKDVPGVVAGGGKWPGRMKDMCEQYMGDIGETVIYDVFKKKPKSLQNLEEYLCYGTGILGKCTKGSKVNDEL